MKPEDMVVLVVGDRVWGKGATLEIALKKMRQSGKSKAYIVYIAHPETSVDADGSLCFPEGMYPAEIHRVGCKKGGVRS